MEEEESKSRKHSTESVRLPALKAYPAVPDGQREANSNCSILHKCIYMLSDLVDINKNLCVG